MRRIKIVSGLIIACLWMTGVFGQAPGKGQVTRCATDEVSQYLQQAFPIFTELEESRNRDIRDWINNKQSSRNGTGRYFPNGPDFIIPVVVHVVHNGEPLGSGTNISYDQIRSQIDALNAGFSKYNGSLNYYQALAGTQYAAVTPGAFSVDTRIRFCLAQNPGNGQAWTNPAEPGVMRYNSPANSRHEYSVAGQTALANLTQPGSAFPSTQYLNIWVLTAIRFGAPVPSGDCPGIQGYANIAGYNGPIPRVIDGVVMRSDVFGDNLVPGNNFNLQPNANPACPGGQSSSQSDLGRILVHEVGHYLGLYHTFHECQSSIPGQCQLTGDLVCDTNPCDQPGGSVGCAVSDMPENFMYYSPDPLLNTFTAGQRERMHAMLNTVRASLVSEENVLATGVLGPGGCFSGTVIPEFTMPSVFCVGQAATFSNIGHGTPANLANQWQWTVTPSAGVSISAPNAPVTDITFTNRGSYVVELTASQSGSLVRSYQQNIQVLACNLQECRKDQQKWIFGWGHVGIDFSDGTPKPFAPAPLDSIFDGNQESYVTITDPATGEILFFTNGVNVYDAAFNQVNASPLHPLGGVYNSSGQIVCIPNPGHPKQYLLIIPNKGWNDPALIGVANDYPSHAIYVIDVNGSISVAPYTCPISFNAPAGMVTNFNQNSFNEQVTAIPHANGRDYWLVFPVAALNGSLHIVSYLLNPAGITQKQVLQVGNGSMMPAGQGVVANPGHNRIAFKYMSAGFGVSIASLGFDNRLGMFTGSALIYNMDAYGLPYPGGIIFYDDTHVYLSKTAGFPNTGLLDMDLLTGQVSNFGDNVQYSRFSHGPDGEIYTLYKPRGYGVGSNGLARIDRVAGLAQTSIAIPAAQLTPSLPINLGLNFWNMQETVQCPPAMASVDFVPVRLSCNSFSFHLQDSARWAADSLRWDFGDGSPVVLSAANQPVTHAYSNPGNYSVSVQFQVRGCGQSVWWPAQAITQTIRALDPNQALPITGPVSICIGSLVPDYTYSSIAIDQASYSWTMAGQGQIRQPSSGIAVHTVQILFGQTAGTRNISLQVTESGCTLNGSLQVNLVNPGPSNAGQDGTLSVCNNISAPVNLADIITGEQPGGYWVRLSGTGGVFDAVAGTFLPGASATNSAFQYIIPESAGCNRPDSSIAVIQLVPASGAGDDGALTVCNGNAQTINLLNLLNAAQPGGAWARVTGTGGIFNAAAGSFSITATATSSRFRYVLAGANGCGNDTAFVDITVSVQPDAGLDGEISLCDSQVNSVRLFDIIEDEQPGGIWSLVSGTGGTLDPLTGVFSQPFAPGIYRFSYRINGSPPCVADESFAVLRYGQFDPLDDTALVVCNNQTVNLNAIYNLQAYTILEPWQLNGLPVLNPAQVNETGMYQLQVGDGGTCFDTVYVNLLVQPPVSAGIRADSIAIRQAVFSLQAIGNGSYEWTWSPPTAWVSNAQSANPQVRLTDSLYIFRLEVTDDKGCKGYDSIWIKVFNGPAYYIPNAFTPNGDGLNDRFAAFPVGIRRTDFFRVFNRYGQMVYTSADPTQGWDGSFKGKPQDNGTFTWIIKGEAINGRLIQMQGTVVLIR
ncbi:MAG TPA: hypothetical protein DHV17_06490 [Chitinophagaceae bacterium]|nr:hypothetical protein [Chitinophagaceae bacterium]